MNPFLRDICVGNIAMDEPLQLELSNLCCNREAHSFTYGSCDVIGYGGRGSLTCFFLRYAHEDP